MALRPLAGTIDIANNMEFFTDKGRHSEYAETIVAVDSIRNILKEVSMGLCNRKDANSKIERLLYDIKRFGQPLFSRKQAKYIAQLRKISTKLDLLSYYVMINDGSDYLFRSSQICKMLRTDKAKGDVELIIKDLRFFGIKKGTHIAAIISASRDRENIKKTIKKLHSLGVKKPAHIAMIMRGSKQADEIGKVFDCLKTLGIKEEIHVAMILQGASTEEKITRIAEALKTVEIIDSYSLSVILSSKMDEIKIVPYVLWLRSMGINKPSNIALLIKRGRSKSDIENILKMLKQSGIEDEFHKTMILISARKAEIIFNIIELIEEKLNQLIRKNPELAGWILGLVVYSAARSSREEKDIEILMDALVSFGINSPSCMAMILQSSRKEPEIKRILEFFDFYDIKEISYIAKILVTSRKEKDIRDIVRHGHKHGMTKGSHMATILKSALPAKDIIDITGILLDVSRRNNGYNRLSHSLIADLTAHPKRLKKALQSVYEKNGVLPDPSSPLSEEDKKYLNFRLLLRNLDRQALFALIDKLFKVNHEISALKECIDNSILEDIKNITGFLSKRELSPEGHITAGLLLFSFDATIRIRARNKLVENYSYILTRYKDGERLSIASDILIMVCTHYNIYHNMMHNGNSFDLRAYLNKSLSYVDVVTYDKSFPESIRKIRKQIRDFVRKMNVKPGDMRYESIIISEFTKRGYDIETIKYALGKKMLSLNSPVGNGNTSFMDSIADDSISCDILDMQLEEDTRASASGSKEINTLDIIKDNDLKKTQIAAALLPILKWIRHQETNNNNVDIIIPISRGADPIGWLLNKILLETDIIKNKPDFLSVIISKPQSLSLGDILTSQLTEKEKTLRIKDEQLGQLGETLRLLYERIPENEKRQLFPYGILQLAHDGDCTLAELVTVLGDAYFNILEFEFRWQIGMAKEEQVADFTIKSVRPLLNAVFYHTEIGKALNGKHVLFMDEWIETGQTQFISKLFWSSIVSDGKVSFSLLIKNECSGVVTFDELKDKFGIVIDVYGYVLRQGAFDWLDKHSLGPDWKVGIYDLQSFAEYKSTRTKQYKMIQDGNGLDSSYFVSLITAEIKRKINENIEDRLLNKVTAYLIRRIFQEEGVWGKFLPSWLLEAQDKSLRLELGKRYEEIMLKVQSAIKEIIFGIGEDSLPPPENSPPQFKGFYQKNPYKWISDMKGLLLRAYDGWNALKDDKRLSELMRSYIAQELPAEEETALLDSIMLLHLRKLWDMPHIQFKLDNLSLNEKASLKEGDIRDLFRRWEEEAGGYIVTDENYAELGIGIGDIAQVEVLSCKDNVVLSVTTRSGKQVLAATSADIVLSGRQFKRQTEVSKARSLSFREKPALVGISHAA